MMQQLIKKDANIKNILSPITKKTYVLINLLFLKHPLPITMDIILTEQLRLNQHNLEHVKQPVIMNVTKQLLLLGTISNSDVNE